MLTTKGIAAGMECDKDTGRRREGGLPGQHWHQSKKISKFPQAGDGKTGQVNAVRWELGSG